MASSAGHPGPVSPGTYWKRRFFVLTGVLAVVALVAYGCIGSSSSDTEQAANTTSSDDSSESPSGASIPPSSPADDASDAGSGGDADGDGSGDGDSSDGDGSKDSEDSDDSGKSEESEGSGGSGDSSDEGKSGEEDSGDGDSVPAPENAGDPCRPADVVTTLETDKSDYAADGKPEFELSVVNTADQTCTVDVGPTNMELRVTSGDDRIFSTADCVSGNGSDKVQLSRGVPHTETVAWDRKRSWKDCPDKDMSAERPGTYVLSLHSDYDTGAEGQVFRLN
ncbi:hypothetical protein FHX37_3139 [Haloactinospora alba]|uniref:DUF4232 domain-containing protein n=1 Tax=Haloactinospora alba TaxID=405555 RepID=A0A543NMT8_9ACTN|nr:hypothetical protein [Haloactinospora alba]TQN33140.1 hypothetical protein FHX37_3139 [Haloactinospora alba]